jgi:hypothetical protein
VTVLYTLSDHFADRVGQISVGDRIYQPDAKFGTAIETVSAIAVALEDNLNEVLFNMKIEDSGGFFNREGTVNGARF